MTRQHVTVSKSLIVKPLLAARVEDNDLSTLKFPVAISSKIDGIRCLKIEGRAVSRSFKPIPNHHIRTLIEKHVPDGMDMEITGAGYPRRGTFQDCTGDVMREDGKPDFKVWVIDYVAASLTKSYEMRMQDALDYVTSSKFMGIPFEFELLMPILAYGEADLLELEKKTLEAGYEGVMVRDPGGRYKCGRSTFSEQILIKLKRFTSMEAKVVSVEPLMHNTNEALKDAFGRTERSTAQAGLIADELMGRLVVTGINGDFKNVNFEVGTGFTQEQRQQIWENRSATIGKIMTITYFPQGCKDAPRFPVFRNWRHPDDIS